MQIEIELQSPNAKEDIYALRNYLQQEFPDVHIKMKEVPAQAGQMVVATITGIIIEGLVEAMTGVTVHELYDRTLKPKIDKWLRTNRSQDSAHLEVLSTIKTNDTKTHYLQSSNGDTKVYDHVNYAIDTDKTRAVLIGTSEFDGGFAAIPPVTGNLEDIYTLLTDKRHIGLPQENIVIAHNKTNTEIEELLLHNSRLTDVDTLFIYISGHGHRTDVKKLYLVAKNTRKIDDYILGGVDFDFIQNAILKTSPIKQKLLVLDTCHSGIATQGSDPMMKDLDVQGTYILTSSPGDEVSYFEKNGRNTYFTGALVDLLKKGIDSANEMLALEDLYEHARTQLQQKNFPHPISKSQLNIPASQFYIARNPAFSAERLKRKPAQLYAQGKLQDAMYEYELLLQKYPDDLELRREAERCRTQMLFAQLLHDADEAFYQQQNYRVALDKYRKAQLLKPDDIIRNKIAKCEERLQNVVPKESEDTTNTIEQEKPVSKSKQQDTQTSQTVIKPEEEEKKSDTTDIPIIKPTSASRTPVIIAACWTLLAVGNALVPISNSIEQTVYGAIVLGVTLIWAGIRNKNFSDTEFTLFTFPVLLSVIPLAGALAFRYGTLVPGILFFAIVAFIFLRLMRKRIAGFHILHLIFGGIAFIYFMMKAVAIALLAINGYGYDTTLASQNYNTGSIIGALLGLGFMVDMFLAWRKRRGTIQKNPTQKPPATKQTQNEEQFPSSVWIALASIWLSIVVITYAIIGDINDDLLTATYVMAVISVIIMATRWRKGSHTEFLIYSFSFIPLIFILGSEFGRNRDWWIVALVAVIFPAISYYFLFKNRSTTFTLRQWILSGLVCGIMLSLACAFTLFIFADHYLDSIYDDDFAVTGLFLGGLLGCAIVYWHYRNRNTKKLPSTPKTATSRDV